MGDEIIREAERRFEEQLEKFSEFSGISKKSILQILISESRLRVSFDENRKYQETTAISTDGIDVYSIR